MNNRPSLGFGEDEDSTEQAAAPAKVLDLSGFQPQPANRPDRANIAKAAAKTNFKSREPKAQTAPPSPVSEPAKRLGRRRLTGRSVQLNIKVRQETVDAFYAIVDANGWVMGEAFEKAVELLEASLKSKP
ncbi:stability/partitioning determinant [Rhizobium leguminosarum]|uniref:stability/partitioning determinant n=1 Tax=Rhizobium leguminosarum TaxID=384 RepID=UPI001037E8A7|nr:stability/partitioning determinant [Rhizobium leguminosarum]TBF85706.1 stability/partitioning determinant [Rhizobium leguminosarum]